VRSRFRSRIDTMKRASYRVLAWLLASVAVLRAAEARPQEAIQAPDPDDREPGSIRAAVVERSVTEVRPVAVLPPFNNSALFDQPLVKRRWQPENEILGTSLALVALARQRMYPVPMGVYHSVSQRLRAQA
jgi:hypothetical protein